MRTIIACASIWAFVAVCGFAQTNDLKKADVTEFRRLISTGSNGEIGKALTAFFQTNAPVARYVSIIPLANKTLAREHGREYIFWFRGKDPEIEGDYWVEVGVDEKMNIIKSVRINGLLK